MTRSLLVLAAALALGATGCSPKCGPSTCTGCCDAQGVCQAPTADHCGQSGAACSTCVGFQLCLVGVCQIPGGGGATTSSGGAASGTAASATASSSSSGSSASSTGSASGSAGSAAGSTGSASSGSSSASTASAGSTGASSVAGSTAASSSTGSTAAGSTAASSSATSTSGGGTTGGTSSSSASSSGGTTGGLLPICASCASSASCASGYCDSTTHLCNSAFACVPSDCAPYACGAGGSCLCGGGTTTGSSSSGGTTGGGAAICAPCVRSGDCASGYCDVFGGFCDSTLACTSSADCGGVACNIGTGSCACGGGTTTGTSGTSSGSSSGGTGGSSGGTTGGPVDQCGVAPKVVGCSGSACPQGYTCNGGVCELNGAAGPLQVTLRWGTTDDLDLHLIEPGTCEVYYGNRTCTGTLDLDSNAGCAVSPTSEENVVFNGTPAAGTYTVKADFWESCNNQDPVPYEVVVRKGSTETVSCGTFHPAMADHGGAGSGVVVTTFTYP